MIASNLIKIYIDNSCSVDNDTLYIKSIPTKLTHLYLCIHQERYGVNEVVLQSMFKISNQQLSINFDKLKLNSYKYWNLTLIGYERQNSCIQLSSVINKLFLKKIMD